MTGVSQFYIGNPVSLWHLWSSEVMSGFEMPLANGENLDWMNLIAFADDN